jgi:ribosomal protein L37AE/L43A
MTTKMHTCETCDPTREHRAIWDATIKSDENGEQVTLWECRNCHQEIPRRTRKPSAKEQAKRDRIDDTIRSLGFDPSALR